ncbi:MAG: carboxypeptidase regulatory-like domain-containing protein [Candidatus Caldarchaeum sp.]
MKPIFVLLIIVLLTLPQIAVSQQDAQSLTVYVTTPDGKPKPGLTVTAQAQNFRETAVTNASGYAVFRQLTAGTYEIIISLRNIELLRKTVEFPSTPFLAETAPLSSVTVQVYDVAQRPVANIPVTLSSPNRILSTTQRTNATGYAVFNDIPYSSAPSIAGDYRLSVTKEGVEVGSVQRRIEASTEFVEISARLVRVNFTFTDLGGSKALVDGTLVMRGTNFTQQIEVIQGFASVIQVISSEVVGSYNASLSMRLGNRDAVVYSSLLRLEADADLVLKADLGLLVVRLVDPSGQPVKGLGVLVGATGYGNFSSGITDSNGEITAGYLPISNRVDQYTIHVFRGRTRIITEQLVMTEAKITKQITIPLTKTTFTVVDFKNNPLSGAVIQVTDPVTGRTFNATTVNGAATAEIFPGANNVTIRYKNTVVFKKTIELTESSQAIKINSINFPVSVRVLDSVGKFVEDLRIIVKADSNVLLDRKTSASPASVELELPREITIDVYKGEELLWRERRFADGPSDIDIRFTDIVVISGIFISADALVSAVLAAILTALMLTVVVRLRNLRQR